MRTGQTWEMGEGKKYNEEKGCGVVNGWMDGEQGKVVND